MAALRQEADAANVKAEELGTKLKALEQENLAKEQEITSLTHRNQLLESEVEKLEGVSKEHKSRADESAQHGTQNEALLRKIQLLEDEAEAQDKTLRETNEKYACDTSTPQELPIANARPIGFARPTSKPATSSVKYRQSSRNASNGRPSTPRWRRSSRSLRMSLRLYTAIWRVSRFPEEVRMVDVVWSRGANRGNRDCKRSSVHIQTQSQS
jgi:hypothetical protein